MVLEVLIAALAPTTGSPDAAAVEPAPIAATPESAAVEPSEEHRPTVHLIADDELTQWLVLRLLDDGYPLVAYREAADVELTVAANTDGLWSVEATGKSTVTFDVEAAEDPAVARLEVLHRSFDALEDVEPTTPTQPPPAAVSLSVAEGSPPTLAPQVAVGVIAAGARLVPSSEGASLQVCASQQPEREPQISVIDAGLDCASAEAPPAATGPVETDSTPPDTGAIVSRAAKVVAAALDSSRAPAEEVVPIEPPPAPKAGTDEERPPGLEPSRNVGPRRRGRGPVVFRGGVGGGLIGRTTTPGSAEADGLLTAGLSLGFEPGIEGWLEVQVRPSVVVDPLIVVETFPAIGLKYRTFTVRRLSLDIGGLVGPEIHTYRLTREGLPTSRGNHAVASAEAMLGFAFKIWKEHEIQAQFRVGGGRERIHQAGDVVLWQRDGVRFGAVLGITLGKVLRS